MKTKLAMIACAAALFNVSSVSAINVGVELALLADVSSSIDRNEYKLQLDGYEAAFRDANIQNLITNTPGGIAVTYVEWSTTQNQRIGWTQITDAAGAEAFADMIAAFWDPTFPGNGGKSPGLGGLTNVAGAIAYGASLFDLNIYDSVKKVIDVSGDGKDNFSGPPTPAPKTDFDATGLLTRQAGIAALGLGIDAINGLPILSDATDGVDLDLWYDEYVKAGSDAFIETATSFEDFESAIIKKLEKEIIITDVPDTGATLSLMGFGLLALVSVRYWRRK